MLKSNFYVQPSLINATDIFSLSDFANFRPGGKIKFGYQSIVDEIFPNKNFKGYTFSIGANLFASVDNVKLYNTDISAIEKKYPASFGVEINYTQFFPANWIVLSFTGTLSNGWNDNDLLNYKDISSNSVLDGNIVAFKEFDGKYGKLETGKNKARISISAPISFWHLNPIPYAVWASTSNNKPTGFLGIYTNILSKRVDFHAFKLPSTFGIGVDKVWQGNRWSKANVFVRGNINLGEF